MDAANEDPQDTTVFESENQEDLDGAKNQQLSDSSRPVAELQIRGGIEDNSKIIFLISK